MPRKNKTAPEPPKHLDVYNAKSEKKKNAIGSAIHTIRERKGLTLEQLCDYLTFFGVSLSKQALSNFESGLNALDSYQFLSLCDALEIVDIRNRLSACPTVRLNAAGLERLEEYKKDLLASGKYTLKSQTEAGVENGLIYMPVSDLRVSAGPGNYLDESSFERMPFPASSVPAKADFGLRVSGDSMEPMYHDEQIVWVQKCESLHAGEVGIFFYDGQGYLKCYGEQEPEERYLSEYTDADGNLHPQPVLLSYNKNYEPKPISPYLPFRIFGRVLKI